jgi:hypothetical protein
MVLVCALDLIGRGADHFPPIHIVAAPPPGASATAQGYYDRRRGAIYLVASAPAFREAEAAQRRPTRSDPCPARAALKMVASVIIHEEWHARHGDDERGAYYAQLTELNRLGAGPGSWAYASVTRAMTAVVEAQRSRRQPQILARGH